MAITSTTTPSSTPSSTPSTTPEALETWGDDALARAVAVADLPALLVALAQVTGDDVYLDPRLRPRAEVPAVGGIDQGGYDAGQKQLARELCLRGLQVFRDSGFATAPEPDTARLRTLLAFSAPGASEEYLPLLAHELDVPRDSGAPGWVLDEVAPGRELRVAVIGAGLSGLVAAHRAQQAGLDVVVFDKNPAAGGTWFENTYPGCRLDTHNYAYAYSFAQKPDWPSFFSTADSIRDYLADFAVDEGIEDLVRYSTRVTSLAWDASTSTWLVCSTGPEGERRETFHAVISAVGQLNVPQVPAFPGARHLRRRGVPHRPVAPRRRPDGQARGSRRHRRQRLPGRPGHRRRGGRAERLPAQRPVDAPDPASTWTGSGGPARPLPLGAVVRRVVPFLPVLDLRRGPAALRRSRPGLDRGTGAVSAANAELREALLGFHRERFANRPDLAAKTTPTTHRARSGCCATTASGRRRSGRATCTW